MSANRKRSKKWQQAERKRWYDLVEAARAKAEAEATAKREAEEAKAKAREAKRVVRKNAAFAKAYQPPTLSRNALVVRTTGIRCHVCPSYRAQSTPAEATAAKARLDKVRLKFSTLSPIPQQVERMHETYEELYEKTVSQVFGK